MNTKVPKIIHWDVCGDCQLSCLFCYSVPSGYRGLSDEQCREIAKKIAVEEVKVVVFTGGEPLLRANIVDLIDFCKKQGLQTAMDTNAILVTRNLIKELDGILDRIGLPLDGSSPEIHDELRRSKGHFQKVIDTLNLLQDSKMEVKINTVVNRINLQDVEKIGEIIEDKGISLWSLYQFYSLGRGFNNRKLFKITRDEFTDTMKKVKEKYPQLPVEGVPYSVRKATYFSISPSGFVYTTPKNGKARHIRLGNILENSLRELWKTELIDKKGYEERYRAQLTVFG